MNPLLFLSLHHYATVAKDEYPGLPPPEVLYKNLPTGKEVATAAALAGDESLRRGGVAGMLPDLSDARAANEIGLI